MCLSISYKNLQILKADLPPSSEGLGMSLCSKMRSLGIGAWQSFVAVIADHHSQR